MCFDGPQWAGHLEDLRKLKKLLSKNPEKLKLIKGLLGNTTTPRPTGANEQNMQYLIKDLCIDISMRHETGRN